VKSEQGNMKRFGLDEWRTTAQSVQQSDRKPQPTAVMDASNRPATKGRNWAIAPKNFQKLFENAKNFFSY